jgi:hypothetical protein
LLRPHRCDCPFINPILRHDPDAQAITGFAGGPKLWLKAHNRRAIISINAAKWPERETVTDDSQGVPLAMMQELARYWAADYDWRKCEAS